MGKTEYAIPERLLLKWLHLR